VGWDGLGLSSFCLVIFYSNRSSIDSGLVTVFTNRVGDVFFLLSFYFFFIRGSIKWEFNSTLYSFVPLFFIFVGAITKSAQLPFSAWLPAAMAAPTPVSSLVHSSTLVTAGVYIMIRFNYIFSFLGFSFLKVLFLLTIILAGIFAVVEIDFKKVVAMSTLRQLGMILFVLSVGGTLLSFLHIIIHAFFKSILFLRTGSIIVQVSGRQDSRLYGRISSFTSFTYFSISCFCLAGFPFFIGFYSKELIISSISSNVGIFIYYVFVSSCLFTIMYSLRIFLIGYIMYFKYSSYYFIAEGLFFVFSVFFIFLKCWVLGGLFYWFFLLGNIFFFSFYDVLVGIFIIIVSILFYKFLKFLYSVFMKFCYMMFMKWSFSGGRSFTFNKIKFLGYENSWIELSGGLGVYDVINASNKMISLLDNLRLGVLFFVSLAAMLYFF